MQLIITMRLHHSNMNKMKKISKNGTYLFEHVLYESVTWIAKLEPFFEAAAKISDINLFLSSIPLYPSKQNVQSLGYRSKVLHIVDSWTDGGVINCTMSVSFLLVIGKLIVWLMIHGIDICITILGIHEESFAKADLICLNEDKIELVSWWLLYIGWVSESVLVFNLFTVDWATFSNPWGQG